MFPSILDDQIKNHIIDETVTMSKCRHGEYVTSRVPIFIR